MIARIGEKISPNTSKDSAVIKQIAIEGTFLHYKIQ